MTAFSDLTDVPAYSGNAGHRLIIDPAEAELLAVDSWPPFFPATVNNGLLLLSPFTKRGKTAWHGAHDDQAATLAGAFIPTQGPWPGTQALVVALTTTNEIVNPSMEYDSGLTGWSSTGFTRTRSSDYARRGKYSMKGVTTANDAYVYAGAVTVAEEERWSASVWVHADVAGDQVEFGWWEYDGGVKSGENGTEYTLKQGWNYLTHSAAITTDPINEIDRIYPMLYEMDTGHTYYVDCWQVEEKAAPTPYCDGDQDSCSWATTAHLSPSTRTATTINLDAHVGLVNGQDPWSFRIVAQMPYDYNAIWPGNAYLAAWSGASGEFVTLYYDHVVNQLKLYIIDAAAGDTATLTWVVGSFSTGDWIDIVCTLDFNSGGAGSYKLYVNGALEDTDTTVNIAPPTFTACRLGSDTTGILQGNYAIAEFAVWDKILTEADIAAIYARPLIPVHASAALPFGLASEQKDAYTLAVMPNKYYLGWVTKEHDGSSGESFVTITGQAGEEGLVIAEWFGGDPKTICDFKWGGGDVEWNFDPGAAGSAVKISSTKDLTVEGTAGSDVTVQATGGGADVTISAADDITLHGDVLIGEIYPVVCRVYEDADQEIANATWAKLVFGNERIDNVGMHDMGSDTERITVPREGMYLITACVSWEASAANRRWMRILLNNATVIAEVNQAALSSRTSQIITTIWAASANDYFEVQVYQDSGAALDVDYVSAHSPEFTVVQLS